MARQRAVAVTVVLREDFKKGPNLERIWNNLLACEMVIEEITEWGGVLGEWDSEDFTILEGVVGVEAVHARTRSTEKTAYVTTDRLTPKQRRRQMQTGMRHATL